MKLRVSLIVAAALSLFVLALSATFVSAGRGDVVPVTWFQDPAHEAGSPVAGGFAFQQRGYYSITTVIHSTGLTPGEQYSVWWVIFNNPAACVEGCGFDDLESAVATGANPAGIGVHFGGRFVGAANGKINIGTRLLEDAVTGCSTVAPYDKLCNPLLDAATAQAFVFLHDHGAATGAAVEVGGAFAAGCLNYKVFETVVTAYNAGAAECFSPQAFLLP
jgi:hypothetical protein